MLQLLQKALIKSKGPISSSLIKKVDSVGGVCVHKTWRLQLEDGSKLFAKTTTIDDFPKLEFEANGLKSLKRFAPQAILEIPQPLVLEKVNSNSVLILPWIDIANGEQSLLGRGLALIHQSSSSQNPGKFGWEELGYIGSAKQIKGWERCWGKCFINLRLIPQMKLGKEWGLNHLDWEKPLASLSIFLDKHKPIPSLVHGDLWSGNAAIQKHGHAAIFDPAIWWADREVDIAMTKLFGGFSKEFYEGYESVWPLPHSAQSRVLIYNLYHLLNHANLFGGTYTSQCMSILESIKDL